MELKRKLGFWETIREITHTKQYGTSIIVTFAQIYGNLTPEIVRQATYLLFQRHPLLQACIEKTDHCYFFVRDCSFTTIPFNVIKRSNDQQWKNTIENELCTPLITNKFLWRIIFIFNEDEPQSHHEVIFSFHHAIGDGFSIVYFINDFIKYCDALISAKKVNLIQLPFLKNVEAMLLNTLPWREYLHSLHQDIASETEPWHYAEQEALHRRKTRIFCDYLTSHELTRLHQYCKRKGLTVNSVLSGALLNLGFSNKIHNDHFSFLTLVDLRPYCKPALNREHFGCYVTSLKTAHQLKDMPEIAYNYQIQLHKMLPRCVLLPRDFTLNDLENFSISNPTGKKLPNDQFSIDFGITNLGYLELPEASSSLKLTAFYFCTSRQAGDIAILANIVSLQEEMFICLEYTEPLLDKIEAEKIANSFLKNIKNF